MGKSKEEEKMTKDLEEAKARIENLIKNNSELEDKLVALEEQRDRLAQDVLALERRAETLLGERETINANLANAEDTIALLELQLESISKEIPAKEEELTGEDLTKYPKMLFKHPGPELIHGNKFKTLIVKGPREYEMAKEKGWHDSTPEALASGEK